MVVVVGGGRRCRADLVREFPTTSGPCPRVQLRHRHRHRCHPETPSMTSPLLSCQLQLPVRHRFPLLLFWRLHLCHGFPAAPLLSRLHFHS